jgi:deoxycytidylate deaminase
MIINAGLTRVVYIGEYQDEIATQYLKLANIQIDHFDLEGRASKRKDE